MNEKLWPKSYIVFLCLNLEATHVDGFVDHEDKVVFLAAVSWLCINM